MVSNIMARAHQQPVKQHPQPAPPRSTTSQFKSPFSHSSPSIRTASAAATSAAAASRISHLLKTSGQQTKFATTRTSDIDLTTTSSDGGGEVSSLLDRIHSSTHRNKDHYKRERHEIRWKWRLLLFEHLLNLQARIYKGKPN